MVPKTRPLLSERGSDGVSVRRLPLAIWPIAVGALAILLWVIFPASWVNADSTFHLQHGRDVLRLDKPIFEAGPTPHPLLLAASAVMALFGESTAYDLMRWTFGYLALGLFVFSTFAVARALGGLWSGLVAASLILTSYGVLFIGLASYLDVLFAALMLIALAIELEAPERRAAALGVLAVAGLLRPEPGVSRASIGCISWSGWAGPLPSSSRRSSSSLRCSGRRWTRSWKGIRRSPSHTPRREAARSMASTRDSRI